MALSNWSVELELLLTQPVRQMSRFQKSLDEISSPERGLTKPAAWCEIRRMMATAIRGERQTTLPAEVCEALDLHPGDQISWEVRDGEIRARKLIQTPELKTVVGRLVRRGGASIMVTPEGQSISPEGISQALREERAGR